MTSNAKGDVISDINFGTCELCGAIPTQCDCFCSLEQALEQLLDNDPTFHSLHSGAQAPGGNTAIMTDVAENVDLDISLDAQASVACGTLLSGNCDVPCGIGGVCDDMTCDKKKKHGGTRSRAVRRPKATKCACIKVFRSVFLSAKQTCGIGQCGLWADPSGAGR